MADPWKRVVTVGGSSAAGDLVDVRRPPRRARRRAAGRTKSTPPAAARVVDRLRADRLLEVDDRLERHERAARRLEARSSRSESACSWYFGSSSSSTRYCAVGAVDRRRPLRAEAVVERVFDVAGVQPERRGLVAVDDQVDARALHLHVVGDVLHLAAARAIAASSRRRPRVQLVGVGALHGQVVGAVAAAPADLKRRRQADERLEAGKAAELRPRSCCAICAAVSGRLARGISCTLKRAVFIDADAAAGAERRTCRRWGSRG